MGGIIPRARTSAPLRDAMAAPNEAAALPSSPFLDSDPTQPPRLRRVDVPTTVVAEAQQQNRVVPVELPFGTQRAGQSVRVRVPCEGRASLAYRAAFDGFMTVNCLSAPRTADEAERVLVAEEVELMHAFRKVSGVDDSAEPRRVCLQLLFPANFSNVFAAHELVDAMAALADTCGSFGDRTVRSVRFSLYGGKAAAPAERVLAREALDRREASGVALVLRWAEAGPDGEPRARAECASVNATNTRAGQRSSMLQSVAMKLALAHCVDMPAAFFYPAAPENARDFETKYKLACDRFHAYSEGTMTEPPAENPLLTSVDRVFLRITPKSRGLAGVVESGAVHALLLCADGQAAQARAFALKHREGLPFDDDEGLLLHALGTRVEQVHLGAAVSMYGSGGKPGEPIRPPGTWVWRRVSLFAPLKLLQRTFYVMSCSADSVLPGKDELTPFANSHFKTVFDASALVTGVAVGNRAADAVSDRASRGQRRGHVPRAGSRHRSRLAARAARRRDRAPLARKRAPLARGAADHDGLTRRHAQLARRGVLRLSRRRQRRRRVRREARKRAQEAKNSRRRRSPRCRREPGM
jgi:hypothetical protein